MGILEAVIRALLYLCGIALAYFLIVWVLAGIGIALPYAALAVIRIMFALVAILVLLRLLWPVFAGYTWFPPSNPPPPG